MFSGGIEEELWHNIVTMTNKIDQGISSTETVHIKQMEACIQAI